MNDSATITETARPAIHLKGVKKSFDGRTVVDVDDLTLGSNPIEGLIGPNGAGKTTLMRLIMHAIKLDTGTVSLSDPGSPNGSVVLSKTPQHRIARLGVVKTNQVIQDFPNLTIWDSLLLAVGRTRNEQPGRIFSERRVLEEHGDEIQSYLDYFSFENPNGFANSAGEKKLLDTIRCLLLNRLFRSRVSASLRLSHKWLGNMRFALHQAWTKCIESKMVLLKLNDKAFRTS